jgi:hypothetical protein
MSIIAAGTTTTTALSSTGNTDGTLQLQVNGTTPSVTLNTLGAIGVGSTPSYGTSGQVLTSGGSTVAPTWASAPSPSGGATVTNPMSANITLTSSSNRVQLMTPSAFGYSITLPDATTISAAGGPIFILKNLLRSYASFPIKVLDSAGTNIGWVVPDYDTEIYLTSTAAATGNWVIETHNPTANGGVYPYGSGYGFGQSNIIDYWSQNIGVSSNVAFGSVAISTNTRYFTGINTQWAGSTVATNALSEDLLNGNSYVAGSSFTVRLSDTAILIFWNSTGSTILARVYLLNADGTTASGGRGPSTTAATSFAGTYGVMDAVAISSTSVLLVYQTTTNNLVARVVSITGTSVTYGTILTLTTAGNVPWTPNMISLLSSSLATIIDQGNGKAFSIGISGTTLTNNGSTNLGVYTPIYGVFTASSTTSVIFYPSTIGQTDLYMRVITNTGTSFTSGTEVALFTSNLSNQSYAVSKLSTGLGMVVASAPGNQSIQLPYYIIAVSGGVPYVKSQGMLPLNINQLQYFYTRNSTSTIQTGISGSSTGAYGSSQQKVVITGAD